VNWYQGIGEEARFHAGQLKAIWESLAAIASTPDTNNN